MDSFICGNKNNKNLKKSAFNFTEPDGKIIPEEALQNNSNIDLQYYALKFFSPSSLKNCGQTSKNNKLMTDLFLDNLTGVAKAHGLGNDYHLYLKKAIQDDFALLPDWFRCKNDKCILLQN